MCNLTKCQKNLLVLRLLFFSLLGTADVSSALEVGDKAPEFTLPSTNGVDISLSDFRGKKWVFLEFYGAAFVPT
jgi:AhpC/TSA family